MPKTADQIFDDKVRMLAKAEKDMDKAVVKLQRQLLDLITTEYLPLFKLDAEGFVIDNTANAALIQRIDSYFDKLSSAMTKDVLSVFVNGLLEGVVMSSEYFVALGFQEKVVSSVLKEKVTVETKLGITPKGRLKKDGYLKRLGQTEVARQRLKDYVLSSLTGDVSFLDFQLGFRNLVI